MPDHPQLSPALRPLRYCPNCGQRLAQKAETCFMCGYDLQAEPRRGLTLPLADLVLVAMILAVGFLWWTRGASQQEGMAAPAEVTAVAPTQAITPLAQAAAAQAPAPTPTATPTVTPTPTPIIYTVVRGDTVERIALQFGISVEDLMIVNGLTSDLIRVDQKLIIPAGPLPRGPDGRPLPTATPTPHAAIYLVEVQAGDTLENIAARLGTTVQAIIGANDAIVDADSIIRPGDYLIVPVGTVVPSATPRPGQLPTATPVPTPTPTPGMRWPAPRLLSPVEGARLVGDAVLLQWLSVGVLAPDEVYVVRVMPEASPGQELARVTKGSSFRVPRDWLARQVRRSGRFVWTVQVARDVRAVAGLSGGLRAASPVSPPRSFAWQADDRQSKQ